MEEWISNAETKHTPFIHFQEAPGMARHCAGQWNQKSVGSSCVSSPWCRHLRAWPHCSETGLKAERINSLCLGEKGHFQREDGSLRIRRRDSPSWPWGAGEGQWEEATEKPRDGTSPGHGQLSVRWVLCLIQDITSGPCLMLGDEAAVTIRRRLWLNV